MRGKLLPKPEALARNERQAWRTCKALVYGKIKTLHYKTIDAQWYRACGASLIRVIVVRVDTGRLAFRVFFCTNVDLPIDKILEAYARRWAIEVTFRDLKQLLGFGPSLNRRSPS